MTTTAPKARSRRWAALAATAALATGAVIAPGIAAAAEIEPGAPVYIGDKQGPAGTGVFPVWSSGEQIGEPDYWAYCIEHDIAPVTGLVGTVAPADGFLGDNDFNDPEARGKVFWVVAHSYPAVSLEAFGAAASAPGISRDDAIVATQYAIWRYTDVGFDADWDFPSPDAEAAYWYLLDGANASGGLAPGDLVASVSITGPTGAQTADGLVGPFTVSTNRPTAAISVDPSLVVTDAAGESIDPSAVADGDELYLDLRGTTVAGEATVRATVQGASGTGSIIAVPTAPGGSPTAEDHAQTVIMVAPSQATSSAEVVVVWTGDAPVAPEPGDRPTLPATGSAASSGATTAVAVVGLLLGAGLLLAARRRARG